MTTNHCLTAKTNLCRSLLAALKGAMLPLSAALAFAAETGPWNMAALQKSPKAEWGPENQRVQEVYFEGEPLKGKPTRVFGYFARPQGSGPFPGMVLLHGGGGKAFINWAQYWSQRGFAAMAIDLAGNGPAGRLADGGPPMTDGEIFRDFQPGEEKDMWTYHAVAAAIRAHSLLLSRPEVDRTRTALTGISWGGYLTCIVAPLDHRFKAAVPVYGCGFIHENSHWVATHFSKMNEAHRTRWVRNFDPSRYLAQTTTPMLFVNGTCDFAYPLDSYQKSYRLVESPVTLSVTINRPHGHHWNFKEVDAFIDNLLAKSDPLPKVGKIKIKNSQVSASVSSKSGITKAQLDYTTDSGPWQQRKWQSSAAESNGRTVTATLPETRPLVCYLLVTDELGNQVGSEHLTLP